MALRICLLWTCLYFNTYAFSATGCSGTEFKSENIGIVLGMILVSILLGIPVGLFYIVLMRSTRFFVKVSMLEICTLADTYKYKSTQTHMYTRTCICTCACASVCHTHPLAQIQTLSCIHTLTQTNPHKRMCTKIYLYKYSNWIIFVMLTSIFMLVSIFILQTCEFIWSPHSYFKLVNISTY